jgi:thiamine-phosphate pyrophosphorylase
MPRRHPPPRLWLMTDERQGEGLWRAIGALPSGAGIVFRHYRLPAPERRGLFSRVRSEARRRGLVLVVAGHPVGAADGVHGRFGRGLRTASVHSLAEIRAAERAGAHLLFFSPVFATRSHPGREPLGPQRFDSLAARTKLPTVALGGMDAERFERLRHAYGWAGIDAWSA